MEDHTEPQPVPPRPHEQYQYQAFPPYYGDYYYNGFPNQGNGYMNPGNYYGPEGNHNPESTLAHFVKWWSKDTFSDIANVISITKAVYDYLDRMYLFFESSVKGALSMANQLGQTKSAFAQIWHAINIFRVIQWLLSKLKRLLGVPGIDMREADIAWNKAVATITPDAVKTERFPWEVFGIVGFLIAVPYFINKLICSKFEETIDPKKWESPGYNAVVIQNFDAAAPNEMSIRINDEVTVAPTYIQSKMNIMNSSWCFALCKDKYGIVPLNHLAFLRKVTTNVAEETENENNVRQ